MGLISSARSEFRLIRASSRPSSSFTGRGAETRLTSKYFQDHFVQLGYIVLAYDKRGVGESSGVFVSGVCNTCPDNVDLLASDASAALTLLAARPEVDAQRVGLWGASQGGWIVPHAAVMNGHAAFMILDSGPTVSARQNIMFERFADAQKDKSHLTPDEAEQIALRSVKLPPIPDFDPLPDLRSLSIPGLWMFGRSGLVRRAAQQYCPIAAVGGQRKGL